MKQKGCCCSGRRRKEHRIVQGQNTKYASNSYLVQGGGQQDHGGHEEHEEVVQPAVRHQQGENHSSSLFPSKTFTSFSPGQSSLDSRFTAKNTGLPSGYAGDGNVYFSPGRWTTEPLFIFPIIPIVSVPFPLRTNSKKDRGHSFFSLNNAGHPDFL